jgi:succinate dehydrogenase / fumarate reductase, iron-sulfur subunit
MAMDERKFEIFRFDPQKDKKPRFDRFSVPAPKGLTVLDALFYIQRNLDGSLAFRSSCRAGVCGSCAMHVNGKYRLGCETQVAHLKGTIRVRPLGHLPVIRDLLVDLKLFWEKYKRIKPYLMPGSPAPDKGERIQSADQRQPLDVIIDCILCASCHAACTVTATSPDYLGPAALLKQARFVLDSRDRATAERLALVQGDDGAFRCHTIYNCQIVCPKNCDPTGGIAVLKRKLLEQKVWLSRLPKA